MFQTSIIDEVTLDGFQVVKSELFSSKSYLRGNPTCTIWPSKICFNRVSLRSLNNCEYVRIEVNPRTQCLVAIPVSSSDKDALRWVKGQKEFDTRSMDSKPFFVELYKTWKLDLKNNYRTNGRLVSVNGKVMLLFDFSKAEFWKTKELK